MFEIILIILVLVVAIGYFRSLTSEQKKAQASIARDGATIGTVAAFKFTKDVIKTSYTAGTALGKTVQVEHADAIRDSRTGLDKYIKDNGGTAANAGRRLGTAASSAVYLDEALTSLHKTNKELDTKLKDIKF
jgi:hypothetical protein